MSKQLLRLKMNSLLQLLWLTFAITPTTAVLVAVYTKEAVTVPCNQSVTLHCNITYREGLSVKQLYWFREDKEIKMCEVTESWDNNTHLNEECNYTPNTQLSLTLLQVQKYDEGKYICKLRSNRGVKESSTTVSLQGSPCYNKAKYRNNDEGPTCVFTGVHPDGEVHWFHGATNGRKTNKEKIYRWQFLITWPREQSVYIM
ncbi:hypothetical protein UPYG_G00067110 [Umbra pygmaea]|uniref:Ig-like domain-containing protein n=1 Tax=Umbra pygmaea TaxID=75934 RepID=A0ABD0XAY2_UMBPY